jgi:hypothetical protein
MNLFDYFMLTLCYHKRDQQETFLLTITVRTVFSSAEVVILSSARVASKVTRVVLGYDEIKALLAIASLSSGNLRGLG